MKNEGVRVWKDVALVFETERKEWNNDKRDYSTELRTNDGPKALSEIQKPDNLNHKP